MDALYFDPFRNRLARDIRNRLSRSFLAALAEEDMSLFQRCGQEYLQQYGGIVAGFDRIDAILGEIDRVLADGRDE